MSAVADPIFPLDTPADGATVAGIVEVSTSAKRPQLSTNPRMGKKRRFLKRLNG